jgi:hypothetical protein
MAKSRFIQASFNSGVLSPLIKGRTDIEQYYKGLEVGKNIVLIPQGGLKRRPGTDYIGTAAFKTSRITTTPTMPEGGTAANINDDDDTTSTTTTTNISTIDPYVIAHYDLGTAKTIEFADIRGIFLTVSGSTNDVVVQWSDDNSFWQGTTIREVGTEARDMRTYLGGTHRYWRLIKEDGIDLTTNKFTLSEFSLQERTANNSSVKKKDFSASKNENYLCVFTDGNCAIYDKATDNRVADIKMPYIESQLSTLRDVQTESVMLLFHEDTATQRLINLGTDWDWQLDDAPFFNIPQFDFDDASSPTPTSEVQIMTFTGFVAGDTFQIDIEGVLSKNITYAGDANANQQSATAANIQKNIQDMPVTGETGVSVARTGPAAYTITISGESTKDFELFSAFATSGTASKTIAVTKSVSGSPRKEDVWSATRGYPRSACFYEGRLVIGGVKSKKQSLFLSKSGSLFDFEIDEGDDDDAIFTTISSRKLNDIIDVYPGRNLQIFTDGSEFTVNVSPITPSSVAITPQPESGGASNLEVKEIDGATIFVSRNGKSLKRYIYNFNEDTYSAEDISVLSPELIKSPVDVEVLSGAASDDANWVFIVNDDGSATVLNTLRAQDINGFTEWTTSGFITDVSVVDDSLYMTNKRTINGVESYFIEKWNFDSKLDMSHTGNGTGFISGLEALEGETVALVADGIVLDERVVSGGQVSLTASEIAQNYSVVEVGIKFIPEFKPMPLSTNIGSGPNQMRLKKILRMNVRVLNTTGMQIDGQDIPARSFGTLTLDAPPVNYSGIIDDVYDTAGWQRESMPTFTCPDPTPMTVLGIEFEVESS